MDRLLKLKEVAPLVGRSVRHLWREIAKGRLPRPVPGKPARLFLSDVEKYIELLRRERDGGKGGTASVA